MLRIHTKDGRTTTLDLSDPDQAREWVRMHSDANVQSQISGLTLASTHSVRTKCEACGARDALPFGIQYSITRPSDFRRVELVAEDVPVSQGVRGGERAIVFADDVRLSLMAHAANPALRIVLSKTGHRKFDPGTRI